MKPATTRQIFPQFEAAMTLEDPSSLIGSSIQYSEDGWSWFKFELVDICPEANTLRYVSKKGKHMMVKPVRTFAANFEVKPGEKGQRPELHASSAASGEKLGVVKFQWGDITSRVFARAAETMAHFKRHLSEPEQEQISWLFGGVKCSVDLNHKSMFSWCAKDQICEVPAREQAVYKKGGGNTLKKSPLPKHKVSKTVLK